MLALFLLFNAEDTNDVWVSIITLAFFGGGGIAYYVLNKRGDKKIEQKDTLTIIAKQSKTIALIVACLIFIFVCYSALPFNHLFDNTGRYSPAMSYIVGIVGILFFGYGLIVSIIRLIKRNIVLQISNEGILIPKGIKKQTFIAWKDIEEIEISNVYIYIYLTSPDLCPVNKLTDSLNKKLIGTNINIPIQFIDYDINQLEGILREKLLKR